MCSFQRTLVKEATAKAGRADGQKQTRVIWAEHLSPVAAKEWESGVLHAKVPDTRAPSAPPRYPRPRSCTIAVVSEVGLGSSCRTTGPEVSARKPTGALVVACWPVRTFPTPSRWRLRRLAAAGASLLASLRGSVCPQPISRRQNLVAVVRIANVRTSGSSVTLVYAFDRL